jgi:hypothetical protein
LINDPVDVVVKMFGLNRTPDVYSLVEETDEEFGGTLTVRLLSQVWSGISSLRE